jgi:uncharacterized protein YgiB involved in biofilm formation
MKRSSILDLSALRKRTRIFVLAPISLAVMAGCSGGGQNEQVAFVTSVDNCASSTKLSVVECQAAYEEAVKEAESTAPRYQYQRDCQAEFGNCENRGGFFVPFMAGYIVSNIVSDSMERKHRFTNSHPSYMYRGPGQFRNKIMTSDGFVVGSPGQSSYRVPRDALKPKPAVTRTISRGGFGATASAKSNWGSSRATSRSSSRGWGG